MRRKRARPLASLLGLLVLGVAPPAAGHPHVWIRVVCAFGLDAEGRLETVRQSWTYDDMYSSYALFGLDADRDGRYSAGELSSLKDEFVATYGKDRFFSKASLDGTDVALSDEAEAVELTVDPHGALTVSFAQRLDSPVSLAGRTFRLQVRDPSVFTDFRFPPAGFATIDPPAPACWVAREDGQPPATADPEALMRALIDGTASVSTRAVTLRCR